MIDVLLFGAEDLENLGTRYLATVLRQHGCSVELASFSLASELEGAALLAQRIKPRVVGLSVIFQYRAPEFFDLAAEIKKGLPEVHICAGGHFPTFTAQDILRDYPAIDSIVRGEGEYTLLDLVRNLTTPDEWGAILGLTYRYRGKVVENPPRRLIENLDSLPFPARDTPPQQYMGIGFSPIVGSRGCHHQCSFCSIHTFYRASGGAPQRFRGVSNLVDEMEDLYHNSDVRFFIFNDDEWFPPGKNGRVRSEALAMELRKRRLKPMMSIKCRVDDVDRDHFLQLREMGVERVYVGVESGSDASLARMNKQSTVDQNRQALKTLNEVGMLADFGLIFFDPDSTLDDIQANINFFRELAGEGQSPLSFGRLEVYAGTPILDRLSREGRLSGNYMAWNYSIGDQRVEMLFRLMIAALSRRHYPNEGLAKQCSIACYEYLIYRYLAGSQADPDIATQLKSIVSQVNRHSLDILQDMLDFTVTEDIYDTHTVNDRAIDWASRANLFDLKMKTTLSSWRAKMIKSEEGIRGGTNVLAD